MKIMIMIPNLKKHMKNLSSLILLLMIPILGFSQDFKSGIYNRGVFVLNNNKFYGYIYDRIGDGKIAPIRECIAYMTGEKNKEGKLEIYFWETDKISVINLYKGLITERINQKYKYDLNFKTISDVGLCKESTFPKGEDGFYSNSIKLEKEMPQWTKIVLIKNKEVSIYSESTESSAVIEKAEYLDGIIVIDENDLFYKVEIKNKIGWLNKKDVFQIVKKSSNNELRLKITSEKSYFHTTSTDSTKQKIYLVKGDIVNIIEEKPEWYYVKYHSSKTVIKGWIKKNDAQLVK